jgi:porin
MRSLLLVIFLVVPVLAQASALTIAGGETFDFVSVYKGGLDQKETYVGLAELEVTFETQKAGLWHGGTFFVHGINVHSDAKPTAQLVGDLQGVNNNEAPRTTRLYQLWYEQTFLEERLSLLGGLHDLNTDFMFSDNAGLYVNGAFGLSPVLWANVGTSVYPLTAPGARAKIKAAQNWELLAGIYDGDPGDADINEHNTHLALKSQDGLLSIIESDFHFKLPLQDGLPGTLKEGIWYHSGTFQDEDDNYGAYAIIDQMIYREEKAQGLSLFFMGSGAPKNRNAVDRHIAAGANYVGLLPGRDEDTLGVAFTSASSEKTLEGTYMVKVNDHLSIQPDFQYVMNPSGDPAIKNASVITLRTRLTF